MSHCWPLFWDLRSRQVWIHLTFVLLLCTINWEVCRKRSKISQKSYFTRSVTLIDPSYSLIQDNIAITGHHLPFLGLYSLKAWLVPQLKSLLSFSLFFLKLLYQPYHYLYYLVSLSYEIISPHFPFLWNIPGFAIFRSNSKAEISSGKASRILSESYHCSWS